MAKEIVMPALEMAQEDGTLVRWLHAEGAQVHKGDPLMEIETDKALMEIEAPETGILTNLSAQAGEKVPVGHVIGLLLTEQEYLEATTRSERRIDRLPEVKAELSAEMSVAIKFVDKLRSDQPYRSDAVVPRLRPASPKARRLAAEHQIDISKIAGTGLDGGLVAVDVMEFLKRDSQQHPAQEYVVVPASRMRGIISERLQRSYQESPHIALTLSIDMGEALQLVNTWNSRTGKPLKITSVLAKAVASTLLEYPRLNSHFVKGEIREYNSVHLGFAVAIEDGLLVPTLRNADKKGLATIQSELDNLFGRARRGRLRLDELKGSTFTLSNLGMFGIEQFSAILNPPEVGILSVGVVKDMAAVVGGRIVPRPLMQATINADHRAVDGAVAAKFLNAVKRTLEDPNFSAAGLAEIAT